MRRTRLSCRGTVAPAGGEGEGVTETPKERLFEYSGSDQSNGGERAARASDLIFIQGS
jgi:hypothetical protein